MPSRPSQYSASFTSLVFFFPPQCAQHWLVFCTLPLVFSLPTSATCNGLSYFFHLSLAFESFFLGSHYPHIINLCNYYVSPTVRRIFFLFPLHFFYYCTFTSFADFHSFPNILLVSFPFFSFTIPILFLFYSIYSFTLWLLPILFSVFLPFSFLTFLFLLFFFSFTTIFSFPPFFSFSILSFPISF